MCSMSAPAQKLLPAPVSTMARTLELDSSFFSVAVSAPTIYGSKALCTSGRLRTTVALPSASICDSILLLIGYRDGTYMGKAHIIGEGWASKESRRAKVKSRDSRTALHRSLPAYRLPFYIRKTPKRVSSMGALRLAEMPRASVRRVSRGSMMPSSHSRALAYQALDWRAYCSTIGAL